MLLEHYYMKQATIRVVCTKLCLGALRHLFMQFSHHPWVLFLLHFTDSETNKFVTFHNKKLKCQDSPYKLTPCNSWNWQPWWQYLQVHVIRYSVPAHSRPEKMLPQCYNMKLEANIEKKGRKPVPTCWSLLLLILGNWLCKSFISFG